MFNNLQSLQKISSMNSTNGEFATEQPHAVIAATEQSTGQWNMECGGIMVQEGDRVGVLRAFGVTWTPAAELAKYKVGYDYSNQINLLHRLDELRDAFVRDASDDVNCAVYFDMNAFRWVFVNFEKPPVYFGDLHGAEIDRFAYDGYFTFFMHLLDEEHAQPLLNVVARAKGLWLTKFLRREVTHNLKSAGFVCRSFFQMMSCPPLRFELRQRLMRELVQSRLGKSCLAPHVDNCSCETAWD